MRFVIVVLLVILALIMVAAVVAYNFWGIWGLAGAFAVLVVGAYLLKLSAGYFMRQLILGPVKMKGRVLKGATLEVHKITPADPPDLQDVAEGEDEIDEVYDEDFDSPEEAEAYRLELREEILAAAKIRAQRQWFLIDMTVTPQNQPEGGFKHWEPADLTIVDPASNPVTPFDEDEDDEVGEIADVVIWDAKEESFCEDEQGKYFGPQRILLFAGINPGQDQIAFRYYFEQFGNVDVSSA